MGGKSSETGGWITIPFAHIVRSGIWRPKISPDDTKKEAMKKAKYLSSKWSSYWGRVTIDTSKARKCGCDDYVVKDVDYSMLMKAVKKLI